MEREYTYLNNTLNEIGKSFLMRTSRSISKDLLRWNQNNEPEIVGNVKIVDNFDIYQLMNRSLFTKSFNQSR